MDQKIVVAGATGNLGGRIVKALNDRGATVSAVVRESSDPEKLRQLEKKGVEILKVDFEDFNALTELLKGASCVVSVLQGLHDVIVDAQKHLLDATVAAGVPRFIPSDYSTDFTKLPAGENRNFDLRRAFHQHLDRAAIRATSIFNGAFAEILSYNTPMLDLKKKSVGYWSNDSDWHLDFTNIDDTAAFTAAAALDFSAPRYLRIAGFQVSPK